MNILNIIATKFAACSGGSFFGFPTWYKYLGEIKDLPPEASKPIGTVSEQCVPVINSLSDVWLIVAAVIEILLRIGILVALTFVVVGGVRYIMSQGEPDKTAQAKNTIQNALIGLVISITATALITFIAGRFANG